MAKKIRAKKKFGQNFLHDNAVIERIIQSFNPKSDEVIYEIGPGHGALSKELVNYCQQLNVIEIDQDIIPILKATFALTQNITIHHQDALSWKIPQGKNRIIGNLPYNISTPLLIRFLYQSHHIKDMLFMLQKEVVKRICAPPGIKAYGRLSVMLQYAFECEELFIVPPQAFNPQPKVDSQIIRLKTRSKLPKVNLQHLEKVVKQAFAQRRKTIKNNLKNWLQEPELIALNIDPKARAETLSVQDYVNITNSLTIH